MRLLVLGGTLFLGRHVVAAALARGHQVTLFNRGRTDPAAFPAAERLVGERDSDLPALRGRSFDAVIDTCGYVPRIVERGARALAGRVGHYGFVSSLSVYAGTEPGSDEGAALERLPPGEEASEDVPARYGALKAECERRLEATFPGRVLPARAGLIFGPHDSTDRLVWWLRRVARGGEVPAPGSPAAPLQLIDARDLAGFLLDAAERGLAGPFNLTGPEGPPLRFGDFLAAVQETTGGDARFTWLSDAFLAAQGVQPMDGLPLWIPGEAEGFFRRSNARVVAAGLRCRPLGETLRDTWAWIRTDPPRPRKPGVQLTTGLTPEAEAGLLQAWHASAAKG